MSEKTANTNSLNRESRIETGSSNRPEVQEQDQLVVRDLTLSYGHSTVVHSLSLAARRGEILAVAGPNGSGKSSLLRALARQIRPESGQICLGGRDIWHLNEKEFAQKIAYMPQSATVPAEMPVADLVALGRNPHQNWWQFNPGKGRRAMEEAMERCGIMRLGDKKFGQLSGGEKQRSLIAMALTQEPDFILLDEPTNNLDFHYQQELLTILSDLRQRQLGIIAVFHDLNIIARLADKVALIERMEEQPAKLAALGPVQEALCPDLVRRVFKVDLTIISDSRLEAPVYVTETLRQKPIKLPSQDCS